MKGLYAMNKYRIPLKVEGRLVIVFLWESSPDAVLEMLLGKDGERIEHIKVLSVKKVKDEKE